ncbi:MAG: hypothetical protein ACMXX6_00625 [Candidatus Woesearchaeota archaeon]
MLEKKQEIISVLSTEYKYLLSEEEVKKLNFFEEVFRKEDEKIYDDIIKTLYYENTTYVVRDFNLTKNHDVKVLKQKANVFLEFLVNYLKLSKTEFVFNIYYKDELCFLSKNLIKFKQDHKEDLDHVRITSFEHIFFESPELNSLIQNYNLKNMYNHHELIALLSNEKSTDDELKKIKNIVDDLFQKLLNKINRDEKQNKHASKHQINLYFVGEVLFDYFLSKIETKTVHNKLIISKKDYKYSTF